MKCKVIVNDYSYMTLFNIGDKGSIFIENKETRLVQLEKKYQGTTISYEFLKHEVELIQ